MPDHSFVSPSWVMTTMTTFTPLRSPALQTHRREHEFKAFSEVAFLYLQQISRNINPLTMNTVSLQIGALICTVVLLRLRGVGNEFHERCCRDVGVDATRVFVCDCIRGVAFEALHSRLALELRKKCTHQMQSGESEFELEFPENEGNETLQKQIHEVQDEVQRWRASMGEILHRYERRKSEEFAKLRAESASQVRLARRQAEQQEECVTKLHATKVQELYDLFLQMQRQQPLTEELLASIQTRTNRQLREVLDSQQQQIQQLQASNFLSYLKHQSLEEDAASLKLALTEKEDILAALTTEFQELIPKLHGYIDAREHLLTTTLNEKTREDFQQLELSLRNEQRENAWMKRALQENKRKRADRLTRLQQQVLHLTQALAEKDDIIGMLERGFCLKDAFQWQQPEGSDNHLLRI